MSLVREARLLKVPLAAALALALAGCGQKGPLYLPDQGGTVVTTPPQSAPEQPPEVSPTPSPQNAPTPPPQNAPAPIPPTAPTPPKKTDKDSDSQTPQ